MEANMNAGRSDITQKFARLFNATNQAFERDALRITQQIQTAASIRSAKRSNGK